MALSNRERVGRAFDLLSEGLYDIVDEVMTEFAGGRGNWHEVMAALDARKHGSPARQMAKEDVQVQLRALTEHGRHFNRILSRAQQSYASELREYRNQWAHSAAFNADDTLRVLDTIERLLQAVDASDSAEDVRKLRKDLLRTTYEGETRNEVKKSTYSSVEASGLKPWREVITPHEDVAKGAFTASEFAADLHLVHTGQAESAEYSDPVEFFSRTYLTEGLSDLLSRALRRLNGDANASPVVNLQTNFGGGKTHSMLALYHLFSGKPATAFPQEIQELVAENANPDLANLKVNRVALVGTSLRPGTPSIKEDGTEVRTLWGELAWQLGGRAAYDLIARDDEAGTNPGEALRILLHQHAPVLILVDEWVAYARQLVSGKDLPAGSFETQFTFAQSLTETVKSVPGAMLVVSIPASEEADDDKGSDLEIGGEDGRRALHRLQNVVGRVADQWRPSSKEESFEIVRRRLFQTPDAEALKTIAVVARRFVEMYRNNPAHFPKEATDPGDDYEKRIRLAYPLHPELLDRLYEDWSTLERFQRTRGVLKLVSLIVHDLWARNDTSAMILPGNVPLSATSVYTDLNQYLDDRWKPIIDTDIDGQESTAHRIDMSRPNLGQRSITSRTARTIFFGAAPRLHSTRKGLEKTSVLLGSAVPDDVLNNYSSALEILANEASFFYAEQNLYWFDTTASLSKTVSEIADRLRNNEDAIFTEIVDRLRGEERRSGAFDRVHIAPETTGDIPDVEEARLVVVHPKLSRRKQDRAEAQAHQWIQDAIERKGSAQRIHRNALAFLVADSEQMSKLQDSICGYLAWKQVQTNAVSMNLTHQQTNEVSDRVKTFSETIDNRIRETFCWVVRPEQPEVDEPFVLNADRVPDAGGKSLAERVASKLSNDEQLITDLGASILGMTLVGELGNLWREKQEVSIEELWGYFTRYIYMPRLVNREVLHRSVLQALNSVLVGDESFAIAAGKEEASGRYIGLIVPPNAEATLQITNNTLLVHVDKAEAQIEADRVVASTTPVAPVAPVTPDNHRDVEHTVADGSPEEPTTPALNTRYYGSITIDDRFAKRIMQVLKEVTDRLEAAGADVSITLEVDATKPDGFGESEVRTINENTQTLKFDQSSFEPN